MWYWRFSIAGFFVREVKILNFRKREDLNMEEIDKVGEKVGGGRAYGFQKCNLESSDGVEPNSFK